MATSTTTSSSIPQSDSSSREILDWTQRVLDACGPRPAGSASCLKAAELIVQDLGEHCDRAELQPFECRPWAFLWHSVAGAAILVVAAALLFFGQVVAAALLSAAVAAVSVTQFGFYRELVDNLFPARRCANAVGVIEPRGPVQRQIVLSSHHDSAYEFRVLRFSRHLYVAGSVAHMISGYSLPLVLGGLLLAQQAFGFEIPRALLRGLALFAGIPALFFMAYFSRRAVPGAGDNLVSTGILVHVARVFREMRNRDPEALAGTRLVLVSFDAEESGLRGSRAFVRDHRELLQSAPTVNLNLESFYRLEDLAVLTVDLNGFVPLSKRLAQAFIEEGAAQGVRVAPMTMIYGRGACDSASFAQVGIEATTLLAVPHDPVGKGKVIYHTREDRPENLEPEAIEVAAKLTLRMVERLGRALEADLKQEAV
ncbi:MAG: M28 family peptidase [Deltaproteobacteria bacterium]|nr:M28 family peptidase [Deltaproteobacteria bacterium]